MIVCFHLRPESFYFVGAHQCDRNDDDQCVVVVGLVGSCFYFSKMVIE